MDLGLISEYRSSAFFVKLVPMYFIVGGGDLCKWDHCLCVSFGRSLFVQVIFLCVLILCPTILLNSYFSSKHFFQNESLGNWGVSKVLALQSRDLSFVPRTHGVVSS